MSTFCKKILHNDITLLVLIALVINFILEILSRHSIVGMVKFVINSPVVFLCNAMIILLSLFIALPFKKRYFAAVFIAIMWIVCGIINYVVLGFRATPFTAADIRVATCAKGLADKYFNILDIVLIIFAVALVALTLVYIWKKLPRINHSMKFGWGIISTLVTVVIVVTYFNMGVEAKNTSSSSSNLAYEYTEYGYAYCLSNSVISTGINRPFDYSESKIMDIKNSIDDGTVESSDKDNKDMPNIIYVQLESFMDVGYIDKLECSDDPTPTFRKLKEEYTSGLLTVPVVGGGTANTEFEVLTSMSMSAFKGGEYPYITLLQNQTCDSIAYDLTSKGYTTHAMHDNYGSFYNRDDVYSNLGFKDFTSIEYMYNVDYNEKGWAKDDVLISNVTEAMDSTAGKDFVFAVTVQPHGKYPTTKEYDVGDIDVALKTNEIEDISESELEKQRIKYKYYVNQIKEEDEFINRLIKKVEARAEDTIIVFYGDHQPSLEYTEEDLKDISMYQTEYVIWDNIGLDNKDEDICAYELTAKLDSMLGIEGNTMTNYHITNKGTADYEDNMCLLEYDMLYGGGYSNEAKDIEATDMAMGISPIEIIGVSRGVEYAYIKGEGFNEFSTVCINGKEKNTTYVNGATLAIPIDKLKPEDVITVTQAGKDEEILSVTKEYIYKE